MDEKVNLTRVVFRNFKAFKYYSLRLQTTNILAGPNNSGKSTILNAFRVLHIGLRRAYARKPEVVASPDGQSLGYPVSTEDIPMSLENVATDYDFDSPTTVEFFFSNGNILLLFFSAHGSISLIPMKSKGSLRSPLAFKKEFPTTIGYIPVLGPLEHREALLDERTIQRGLSTHRASRHFRNYWYHYPENFDDFAKLVRETWPGMEIQAPELVDFNIFAMFCAENRITREIYWSGFGFQIWCQILTHLVRNKNVDLLIVDEPDIYLHPDHQRQILTLLRNTGPSVLLATHSTEMLSQADPSEIVIIDKSRKSGHRLESVHEVQIALDILGSYQNIVLTQLSRTRRVLFVEGSDFKIISRMALKLELMELANEANFTVVPIEGFSQWEKIEGLAWGFEKTLGVPIAMGLVLDRDYRCEEEIEAILHELKKNINFAHIHQRKEIENYLLTPIVLERAINSRVRSTKMEPIKTGDIKPISEILDGITSSHRTEIQSKYIDNRIRFFKSIGSPLDISTITKDSIDIFDKKWQDINLRMEIVPGKKTFSKLNQYLQDSLGFNLTLISITNAYNRDEIPEDMSTLLRRLNKFRFA